MLSLKQAIRAYADGSPLVTDSGEVITILDVDTDVDSENITEQQALGRYNWWVQGERAETGQSVEFLTKVGSEIKNLTAVYE